LIDDLVTRGVSEPYRIFTSRAEYRLLLRADNADQRLTPVGVALGCVGEARRRVFEDKAAALAAARTGLARLSLSPNQWRRHGIAVSLDGQRRTAHDILAYRGLSVARLATIWPELGGLAPAIAEQLEIDARYAGYLERQAVDIAAFRKEENLLLPADLDYGAIGGLSNEVREKLAAHRPATLGAAGRIPGITPAALTALLSHSRRGRSRQVA
jgi:tRNA uridine 5-carboxymethylaminomethyl modification enzyme